MTSASETTPDALYDTTSRKTLYYLKSALNASFGIDYDFSTTQSHEFTREPHIDNVRKEIDGRLVGMPFTYCLMSGPSSQFVRGCR